MYLCTLFWNNAAWMVKTSRVTFNSKSECFISALWHRLLVQSTQFVFSKHLDFLNQSYKLSMIFNYILTLYSKRSLLRKEETLRPKITLVVSLVFKTSLLFVETSMEWKPFCKSVLSVSSCSPKKSISGF